MSAFIFNAKAQRGRAAYTAETVNIQQSTFNVQAFPVRAFGECWALNVECRVFPGLYS